uniref:Uncharacterized protein n=1 Tax=Pygocentrus nattereri TaxID=42514 RepID=A0AAR2JH16_PYGNA
MTVQEITQLQQPGTSSSLATAGLNADFFSFQVKKSQKWSCKMCGEKQLRSNCVSKVSAL